MAAAGMKIGRVASIYRYPVKSMRGERLDAAEVGWRGLAGDRRYAFIDLGNRSGFPWLTARQFSGLLRYEPRFESPGDPGTSRVLVRTPAGRDLAVDSAELLDEIARESARDIRLLHHQSGVFDTFDFSIVARQSIEAVSKAIGRAGSGGIATGGGRMLDERRFRPNVVLDCAGDAPFCEDGWIGGLVRFGERGDSAGIRINRADLRCMVINIDPDDLASDPAVLRYVAQERANQLGVYGSVQVPGTIRAGEDVFLSEAP